MPKMPIIIIGNDSPSLSEDLPRAAVQSARNLGYGEFLPKLTPEHWQIILTSVEAKMRMRGQAAPPGWQLMLERKVGRSKDEPDT